MAGSIDPPDEPKDPQHIIDYENRMNAMWSQQLSAQQSDTHRESRALSPEERSQQNLDSGAITPRIYEDEKNNTDEVIKKAMDQLRQLHNTTLYFVGSIPPTPFAPEEYYSSESIPPTADYTNTHAFVDFIRDDNEGFKLYYDLNTPQQTVTTNGSQFLDDIEKYREEYRLEYGINQDVKIDETTQQISRPQQSLNDKEKFSDVGVFSQNFYEERKESKSPEIESPEIDDKTKSASSKSPDNDKSFSSSNTNTPFVSSELSSSTTQIRPVQPSSTPAQRNEPKPTTSPAQPVSKQGGTLDFILCGLGA